MSGDSETAGSPRLGFPSGSFFTGSFLNARGWATLAQIVVGGFYLSAMAFVSADALDPARNFAVSDFDRIYLSGNATVHVEQNSQAAVSASGEQQALADLKIDTSDGAIYIQAGRDTSADNLHVHLSAPNVREVVLQGNGLVKAKALRGSALVLEGYGAGAYDLHQLDVDDLVVVGNGQTRFQLSGRAQHQWIELAGVSQYNSGGLYSETTEVSVSGEGSVAVWADELLEVDILGSAIVNHNGQPWRGQQILSAGVLTRRSNQPKPTRL